MLILKYTKMLFAIIILTSLIFPNVSLANNNNLKNTIIKGCKNL